MSEEKKKRKDKEKKAEYKVDEARIRVMPKKIIMTPKPVDVPVESGARMPKDVSASAERQTQQKKRPSGPPPELKEEHRLVFTAVMIIVTASLITGGIVWWYQVNPVQTPVEQTDSTSRIIKRDVGIASSAANADGRTVGSVRVRVPVMSQTGDTNAYRVQAVAHESSVAGAYVFAPQGLRFNGPITMTFSYFDSDMDMLGIDEKQLRIFEDDGAGNVFLYGKSVVDINQNQISVAAQKFPDGVVYVGVAEILTPSVEPEPQPEQRIVDFSEYVTQELSDTPIISASDLDEDGLTDIEEQDYGTDQLNPDTDGDGYADGLEVRNAYSPVEGMLKRIVDSRLVAVYTHTEPEYSIVYPSTFVADGMLDNRMYTTMFTPLDTGEMIQFIAAPIAEGETASDWYASIGGDPSVLDTVDYRGTIALRTPDQSTLFWVEQGMAFGWIYHTGLLDAANYLSTWELMQESLHIRVPDHLRHSKFVSDTRSNVNDSDLQEPLIPGSVVEEVMDDLDPIKDTEPVPEEPFEMNEILNEGAVQ